METKTENLCNLARQLKLTGAGGVINDLLISAQQQQISYLDFAFGLFNAEIDHRNQQNLAKRLRNAKLPANHDLELWQENHLGGISRKQVTQLCECIWLEQNFNIILMGPSGTGKSFIAAGLCYEALLKGYKACFRSMEQLNHLLKIIRNAIMSLILKYQMTALTKLYRQDWNCWIWLKSHSGDSKYYAY